MTLSKNYKYSYKKSGVNVSLGNELIKKISPYAKETKIPGTISNLGGFGGVFDLRKKKYKDPLLVTTTDGVGTKIILAKTLDDYSTIGIDLVAMSVNDLIVQGAEPLLFLDYLAVKKLNIKKVTSIIKGIKNGCLSAGCALIGGETAELSDLYNNDNFDLAGFALGIVERKNILPKKNIKKGDIIIGLSSNGIHSNGYSLIRSVIKHEKLDLFKPAPFDKRTTLGKALLKPTKIYVKTILSIIRKSNIKAIANITGGGITHNLPRVLPNNLGADINISQLYLHKKNTIFQWLHDQVGIDSSEMLETFNCGIGMIIISQPDQYAIIEKTASLIKEKIIPLGQVTNDKGINFV